MPDLPDLSRLSRDNQEISVLLYRDKHVKVEQRKYYQSSVLPRLRFCAIVTQNFLYDAAKTVPVGHLAHIDFGLSQDLESVGCVENSLPKINLFFTGIPEVVTAIFIGVLDF